MPSKRAGKDKGVPIPYADARAAPWYDTEEWGKHDPQAETKAPKSHLLDQYGEVAAEFGFDRVGGDVTTVAAWRAAEKAAKMKIRAAPWTASVGRIMRSLAVFGSLGPDGAALAAQYMAVLAEMAAVNGHDFAIEYDDKLRAFIAKEAYTIDHATPYLRQVPRTPRGPRSGPQWGGDDRRCGLRPGPRPQGEPRRGTGSP